ncbi:MAG TPA: ABC transporter permease [Gemmatimonadaceae bacterium]|nr:ABC transporter permease [Gemmatimonadaceae bacterium]
MNRRFILGRLLQVVPTMTVILLISFLLIHLAPGDAVFTVAGEHGDAAYYAFMRHRFGLDQPLPRQFLTYLGRVVNGDLGFSYVYGRGTLGVILERVPATLLLTGTALAIAVVVAIPLGAVAAARPHGAQDVGISAFALALYSTPAFWVGQLAIIGLSLRLGLFPVQGMTSAGSGAAGWPHAWDVARHLALPAMVLAAQEVAVLVRIMRSAMLDELPRDHVRTARAKGFSAMQALVRHALPRALLPIVTIIGARVGHLIAGAAVVEIIFGWPGMGRLLIASLQSRDAPILLGLFLVVSLTVVLANLLSDLVYAAIDPRIRVR